MDLVVSPPPVPAGEYVPTADQRIVMHGVSWAQYERQLAQRGEASSPRIAYFEGTLELMSPSIDHEDCKTIIARLLEAYAEERDLDLRGYGGATFRKEAKQRGLEPDECYTLGPIGDVPAIAITGRFGTNDGSIPFFNSSANTSGSVGLPNR